MPRAVIPFGPDHRRSSRRDLPIDCSERELITDDAHRLFVRYYHPAAGAAQRTLLIVHGLSEHGGRYEHVARLFVERGWRVIVGDLRGHGRSGGTPTHVRDFQRYVRDLESIRSRFGADPEQTAILGHSMGGLVAIHYALSYPDNLAALALSSPLLRIGVPIPRRKLAVGRMLSFVVPRARFRSTVDPAHTTRCAATLADRTADPLIRRSVTAGLFFAMQSALTTAWNAAPTMQLPIYIAQAGGDRIVDPGAATEWTKRLGSGDIHCRQLPEQFHEILNEPEWAATAHAMADWLERRIAPGACDFARRAA